MGQFEIMGSACSSSGQFRLFASGGLDDLEVGSLGSYAALQSFSSKFDRWIAYTRVTYGACKTDSWSPF